MIDLTKADQVKALKSNLRFVFESPSGQEVMKYLEGLCGWYDFNDIDPNVILIKHGKRQVLATIKTFLELNPEQIIQKARESV